MQAHARGDVRGVHGNSFLGPLILKAMYFYIVDTVTTLIHSFLFYFFTFFIFFLN